MLRGSFTAPKDSSDLQHSSFSSISGEVCDSMVLSRKLRSKPSNMFVCSSGRPRVDDKYVTLSGYNKRSFSIGPCTNHHKENHKPTIDGQTFITTFKLYNVSHFSYLNRFSCFYA